MKLFLLSFIITTLVTGCGLTARPDNRPDTAVTNRNSSSSSDASAAGSSIPTVESKNTTRSGPKTVREFFMELPEKYFTIESCDREKDKDCKQAKEKYLKEMGNVIDIANGYIKCDCDGAQACIEMAIFKRPDGSYMVGLATFAEMMNDFYFLDLTDGKWQDISNTVIPEYSNRLWYEVPRHGTVVKVYEKKITEQTDEYQISERGRELYRLEWSNGKFTKKNR